MLSQQSSSRPHGAKPPPSTRDREEGSSLSHSTTMSPMIPLHDLCVHFQDLPSFVHHPDFDHFAYCWMEFQYHMAMSQHVACRPRVKAWLVSMSVHLLSLVAKYPPSSPGASKEENHEASTFHIRSAYQRLVHHFGVLHKLLDMVDIGNTVANQSPQEVVLPIYNSLLEYRLNQQLHHYHQQHPSSPTPTPPSQTPLHDSFSLTSSSSSSSSTSSGTSTPTIQLSLLSLSSPESTAAAATVTTTSSFRSLSCMELIPYLNESYAPSPHIHPMSLALPSSSPFVHKPLAVPKFRSFSSSTPATPSASDQPPPATVWSSCPVSPSHPRHNRIPLPDPLSSSLSLSLSLSSSSSLVSRGINQEMDDDEPITPLPLDYHHYHSPRPTIPNWTIKEESTQEDRLSSEYRDDDDDNDHDYSPPSSVSTTTTNTTTTTTTTGKKDAPSNDKRPKSAVAKRIRRRTFRSKERHTMSLIASAPITTKNTVKIRRCNRTATSYDQDTTHYLKSMFFNIYSKRDKLTKEQRRQVVERTGLKPRNVTYWFSNHKRRFQSDLDVFRKLIAKSEGRVQTYDDYVTWRREQGLPEDMGGVNDM